MQEVSKFIAAIKSFNFFKKYEEVLTPRQWIILGLFSKITPFNPMEPICLKDDLAKTVYLILSGHISVTLLISNHYKMSKLEKKTLAVLKSGISFGELAVLYDTRR